MPNPALDAPESTADSTAVTLHVLFFSVLHEKTGRRELTLTLDAPISGTDLLDHLSDEFPTIEEYRPAIRLAVNESYVAPDTQLEDGDEVALITPVSGG